MPLTFDPNYDTTPVIIDKTLSRKKKQQNFDKYAHVAVKRRKKDEANDAMVQKPPAGTVQTTETVFGIVKGIVPHIQNGRDVGTGGTLEPSVWHELSHSETGTTEVPYRNYKNYLKDPEYIEFVHKRVIGMIKAWVQCMEETVNDLQQEWDYSWDAVMDQLYWARRLTDAMMVGLSKFKLFPVTVLNLRAIVELVEGVDDEEKADLVLNLANCKLCEVAIIRNMETNNVCIVTIYDHNNNHKVAYGKGSIKDLTHLEPSDGGVVVLETRKISAVRALPKL
jgi:hypothetical protein